MFIYQSVILITVVTGCFIVLGGLYLIAKGLIKLVGDASPGTTVKLGDIMTLSTTVPGLGIFLLGFVFESAALYCANQLQDFPHQLQGAVADAVAKERYASTLHLRGVVQVASDQDAVLSFCVGQKVDVPSNEPFDETIGPDFNFLVVSVSSPGALPQNWTVASSDMRQSFLGASRLIIPQNGVGDLGAIKLNQIVNLTPALNENKLAVAPLAGPIAAGSAYGSGQ